MTRYINGPSETIVVSSEDGLGVVSMKSQDPEVEESPDYQEAHELLEGLVDYLMTPGESTKKVLSPDLPAVLTIPLPADTSSWIIDVTPWIWGGGVLVCKEALQYYEDLHHLMIDVAGRETKELLQIVYLRRASWCKDIIHELQRALERI